MPDEITNLFTKAVLKEVNEEERSFVAYGSTKVVDRDNEIIDPSGWKFPDKVPLLFGHNWSGPAIGKTLWIKTDKKGLKFKGQFAPTDLGQELWLLYSQGYMDSFSVGFRSITREVPDDMSKPLVHKEQELYEISAVTVPANPEAVIQSINDGKIHDEMLIKALKEAMPDPKPIEDHTDDEKAELLQVIEGLKERIDNLETIIQERNDVPKAEETEIDLEESIEIPDESIEVPDKALAEAIKKQSAKVAEIILDTKKGKVREL